MSSRVNESPEARERRLARERRYQRTYARRHPEKRAAYQRGYRERLKNGEIQLPPLDWAICARGGSEAQAMAHYRRGEKPCEACGKAMYIAKKRRETIRREQAS